MLALDRDDDPSSNEREGDSQCNVFPETSVGGRGYLAHVHAKDTLIKILIIKFLKNYGLEKEKKNEAYRRKSRR